MSQYIPIHLMSNIAVLTKAAKIAESNPAASQFLMEVSKAETQSDILDALRNYDDNVAQAERS